VTRDLGRVGSGRAGRHAGRWAGGIIASLLLAIAGPATARQAAATATPSVRTYAECTRAYAARRDAASYCRRLFPATPAVTSYDTCVEASGRTAEARKLCAQRYPDTAPKPSEPIDITPQLNQLIDSWANRPRPTKPPPADPLAVVPGIQAACAQWVGNAERWLACTADGWRGTGLRGQPPQVLLTPPAPPVVVPEPTGQTPVKPPPV
jgi:type II secretory pathway pseudopilin PulG